MTGVHAGTRPLTQREVRSAWWPLAASWLCMGLELPAVSAVLARLDDPRLHLAAYGGVVFPLCLLIESPIIMLLAAATALARDRESYRVVQRFMRVTAGALTGLHALLAFTPLFDLVVVGWMGAPADIREPARLGLQILLPWTFSIAYRRTQQGVLIRNGHARAVSVGTAVRLASNGAVLLLGLALRGPGIVVGSLAVAAGVVSEALYAAWRVRRVLRDQVPAAAPGVAPLTLPAFVRFYLPLSVTPLLLFLAMPLTSAAMTRLPRTLDSLAVWPVVSGLVFVLRSLGFALHEVVVALLERPGAAPVLRRFAVGLAVAVSGALLLVTATPLSGLWFGAVSALDPDLVELARAALWVVLALPAVSVIQSYWQGAIVHGRRTRGITEAVALLLAVSAAVLAAGAAHGGLPGILVGLAAMMLGNLAMVAWMRWRAAPVLAALAPPQPVSVVPSTQPVAPSS